MRLNHLHISSKCVLMLLCMSGQYNNTSIQLSAFIPVEAAHTLPKVEAQIVMATLSAHNLLLWHKHFI